MTQRTWRFPRLLLSDWLALTMMLGAGFFVAVMAVVFGVSLLKEIVISGWEPFSGATLWYVAFVGGYLFHQSLPVYVAHGRTRRDFAIEAVIFVVVFSAVTALLITLGFLLESGVYEIASWERGQPEDHLFSSYGEYPLIFAEYWLTYLVWAVAGGLVGAAWYRSDGEGALSLIPAAILVGVIDMATGASLGGPFDVLERLSFAESPSIVVAILAALVCVLIAAWLIWSIIREIPIRNRSS